MNLKPKELTPQEEGKKCGANLAKSVCKLLNQPRFQVGQDIWFRYKQNRPAPVSVVGYGKKPKTYDICSLEGVFILQDVEEKYLYATEEEAREANH